MLGGDVYKGIFAGVFIFLSASLLPYFYKEIYSPRTEAVDASFFSRESWGILAYSVVILTITSLLAGIILLFLNVNYCDEKSIVFSERLCALSQAEDSIYEKYGGPYDDMNEW